MRQVVLYFRQLCLYACNQFVGLVLVVFQDALHLYLEQSQNVVARNVAVERILEVLHSEHLRLERFELRVDEVDHLVLRLSLLELLLLVDALLDEDALQRREEELLLKFSLAYLQLAAQEAHSRVGRVAQHVAHGEEARLVVFDDTAVGRDVYLAVGEGVERVDSLVGRHARRQVNLNLHLGSRVVVHLLSLYLAFLDSTQNGVDERRRSLRERNLANDDSLRVELLYLCAHLHGASALSVVVLRNVYRTARREVGVEVELLAAQICDGSVADLHEVVWQNLRAETHGDALSALRQQQRELRRQRDRLLVASVVRELPVGSLWVEHHVKRELGESRLDVTRRRSTVAREDVTPVALAVDEQVFLSHLHESVADGSVAVRVELHSVSDDVRHLVEASVVHALHRVKYASLHRLQAVLDMRYSAFQDYVGCVVEEPVLIHSAKVVYGRCVEAVNRLVVGMFARHRVFYLVVHI